MIGELIDMARREADRTGEPMAVFAVTGQSGRRLLLVAHADEYAGENRMVDGPFFQRPRSCAGGISRVEG